MSVRILDMPEDVRQLRGWLAAQVTGPSLAEVVGELATVHRHTVDPPVNSVRLLDDVLGDQTDAMLNIGLDAVSDEQCQQLLVDPALLFELQRRVASDGGAYWIETASTHEATRTQAAQIWDELSFETDTIRDKSHNRRRWLLACLTVAALFMAAAVIEWNRTAKPSEASWGWMRDNVLDDSLSAPDYLNKIADSAEEWFDERPDDRAALSRRIRELSRGCQRLIAAQHRCLSDADRVWLVDRCRIWSRNISFENERLDARVRVDKVRSNVDEIVRKLSASIRNRAVDSEEDV